MSIASLYDQSDAVALAAHVAKGDISPSELLDEALRRAEALNPQLNALTLLKPDVARRLIAEGLPDGPLKGVPFLLKDLGAEATDFPAHNGSKSTMHTVYDRNSAIYERLAAAGLVTFGRTTAPEGGVGPATEAAVYGGPTRNPWHLDRTPGGSSGGAGAAVSAGIVPAAHGSDGGGSVRIPASSCGLFGFKATRARLPDGPYAGEGWAGMAIDGFLTRSVRDTAVLVDAAQGADLGAPYWAPPLEGTLLEATARKPGRLRIAFLTDTLTGNAIDPECRLAVENTIRLLEEMGHDLVEARPSADTRGMMEAWIRIVACGNALWIRNVLKAKNAREEDGLVESVGLTSARFADSISGADYLAAVGTIHRYGREMAAFFADHDMLLTATLAEPPAQIGRFAHGDADYVEYRMGPGRVFDYSPFCTAFNASGQPAVSLPLHWTPDGLPVGVQLAARFGADELLMSLSAEIERARPWFAKRPPLWAGA